MNLTFNQEEVPEIMDLQNNIMALFQGHQTRLGLLAMLWLTNDLEEAFDATTKSHVIDTEAWLRKRQAQSAASEHRQAPV